jgi:hypothetical protein
MPSRAVGCIAFVLEVASLHRSRTHPRPSPLHVSLFSPPLFSLLLSPLSSSLLFSSVHGLLGGALVAN